MERLGDPVHNVKKRRSGSMDAEDEEEEGVSPPKVAKKKKKEKKKKEKKEKKKKRSRVRKDSDDGDSNSNQGGGQKEVKQESPTHGTGEKVFDAEEEDLLSFFEEGPAEDGKGPNKKGAHQDDLMARMSKKNKATLKRMREIEEDKAMHH